MTAPVEKIPRAAVRARGHERIAALLDAAAQVFAERGFDGARMTEIAERAGAGPGSLYRFFPSKEALADALEERYLAIAGARYDAAEARLGAMSIDELADFLLSFMVALQPETAKVAHLFAARGTSAAGWARIRAWATRRIAGLLRGRMPALSADEAAAAAAVVLGHMKMMTDFEGDPVGARAAEILRGIGRDHLALLAMRSAPLRPGTTKA